MANPLSIFMRIVCAIVFCAFSFSYLYFYQADVMYVAQHIASEGKTYYVPWMGAILITAVLQLLQVGVFAVIRLYKRFHALTYLPSLLILAVITSLSSNVAETIELGPWKWVLPVVIVVYALIVIFAINYQEIEPDLRFEGPFSQLIWVNVMGLAFMMFIVCMVGNHDAQFHQRAHIQRLVEEDVRHYVEKRGLQEKHDTINLDGRLCNMMMRKDLNGFAALIKKHYQIYKYIPKPYCEALTLYQHQPGKHLYFWRNKKMEKDFRQFTDDSHAMDANPSDSINKSIKAKYGESYWYYYKYL